MKCPGQDTRYWRPGAIFEVDCPQCGAGVEFFKDDTARTCKKCGHRFANPDLDFGCAAYCQYAEQCIGDLPPELVARKDDLLKDRVALEMKRHFKRDFKRIGHATRVARYAEQIGKLEQGSLAVILTAAYLLDIGVLSAEEKHPEDPGKYHEAEGQRIAREILNGLRAPEGLMDEVSEIIRHHHHPGKDESIEFQSLYDADRIAILEEEQKKEALNPEDLKDRIETTFLTEGGRKMARKILIEIQP